MANLDPKTMALLGAASGLLGASGYSARPISMGEAMGQGLQGGLMGYGQGVAMQRQAQQMEMEKQQLERQLQQQQMLSDIAGEAKGDRKALSERLIASGHPELMKMGVDISPKVKTTKTMMVNGIPMEVPISESGEFMTPSPYQAAVKSEQVGTGGQQLMVDPYTNQVRAAFANTMGPGEQARLAQAQQQMAIQQGQFAQQQDLARQRLGMDMMQSQMQRSPEFIGMKEEAKLRAKNKVEAQSLLPDAEAATQNTVNMIDGLINHPGFDISVGAKAPLGFAASKIPGTPAASWRVAFDQLQGEQFLQAIQRMRGFGALTEKEGDSAAKSMSRMQTTNTKEDFIKSANEVKKILLDGVDRMRNKAGLQQTKGTFSDGWGDLVVE